jgi:hypothetical protein
MDPSLYFSWIQEHYEYSQDDKTPLETVAKEFMKAVSPRDFLYWNILRIRSLTKERYKHMIFKRKRRNWLPLRKKRSKITIKELLN